MEVEKPTVLRLCKILSFHWEIVQEEMSAQAGGNRKQQCLSSLDNRHCFSSANPQAGYLYRPLLGFFVAIAVLVEPSGFVGQENQFLVSTITSGAWSAGSTCLAFLGRPCFGGVVGVAAMTGALVVWTITKPLSLSTCCRSTGASSIT